MWDYVARVSKEVEDEKVNKFQPGEDDLVKVGPKTDGRGCTDVWCLPIFVAAQLVFIVVTCMGCVDGDPEKLYRPRDFQGAYCGVEENWNTGPNTKGMPKASYTMNLSSTVNQIFKQLACSSAVRAVLTTGASSLLANQSEVDEYLCDCCHAPCARCRSAEYNGGDLGSASLVNSVIGGRMAELTGQVSPATLFNPSVSENGNLFSSTDFWGQATQNFNKVCLPSCNMNFKAMNSSLAAEAREYKFSPSMDDPLYKEWQLILGADDTVSRSLQSTIGAAFTFNALPESVCPYHAKYCVPMPGVSFEELIAGSDHCTFKLEQDVINEVGSLASTAFTSLGGDSLLSEAHAEVGDLAGDFERTIDSFIIVAVIAFVAGISFLVLLRMFIAACVWSAVLISILFFIVGGFFCLVRSKQCQGAGFFHSGHQAAVALVVAAKSSAEDALSSDGLSEALTGDGSDYRGAQSTTVTGRTCADWATQDVDIRYRKENFNTSGLDRNYCRNPYYPGQMNKATSIWCFTSDPKLEWEECQPIGVIQPICQHGYAVAAKSMRDVLFYLSFVIWGLGLIWFIVIMLLTSRIRLAIALNKVAAVFLAHNPHILLVPIVQTFFAIVWTLGWLMAACFLLSQVPDSYIPQGYYASYEEAFGTSSECAAWEFGDNCTATPGACTSKWPTGSVWKTDECQVAGDLVKCWRCYPPRFNMDWRFFVSLFVFLWNSCFNIALGQLLVAMATAIWFFKPSIKEKCDRSIVPLAARTVFRSHVGSVVFGSFIVALVRFIRYVMKYFEKQAAAQTNRVLVLILKVLQCAIWCFEKCIQFLNKNAYIQIALTGSGFCKSAKKAFFLIFRNAVRFGTVAVLSGVVHSIGYVCIMTGTMVAGYFIVGEMHDDVSPVVPLFCYAVLGYISAKLFMNVFGLAVDTSLQCFIAAEEMGEVGEYVPKELQVWIKKNVDHKEVTPEEQAAADKELQNAGKASDEENPALEAAS